MRVFLFVVAALGCGAMASPLVVNGGFETGDFTGWTVNAIPAFVECNLLLAHSGTCYAFSDTPAIISQDIPTVDGHSYTLEFWVRGLGVEIIVRWKGTLAFDELVDGLYQHEVIPDLLASGTSTTLQFETGFSRAGDLLDDVNVVEDSANAPEPSTAFLMLLAGLAAGVFLNRRKPLNTTMR